MKWCAADARLLHARAISEAMLGRINDAVSQLLHCSISQAEKGDWPGFVATQLVRSQILSMDRRDEEALNVFDVDIEPHLNAVDPKFALIVGDNRQILARNLMRFNTGSRFYGLQDQMVFVGLELFDPAIILDARNAREKGSSHQSIAAISAMLLRAYDLGSWKAMHFAEEEMALEYMSLHQFDHAAWHAVMAQDEKLTGRIAESFTAQSSHDLLRAAIVRLLRQASLERHAAIAGKLLGAVADAIPDDCVDEVTTWLLRYARKVSQSIVGPSAATNAWEALAHISHRLDATRAAEVVDTALSHAWWEHFTPSRRELIHAVRAAIEVADVTFLDASADRLALVATRCRNDFDYDAALNLVCSLAVRCGGDTKARLADCLFPPGIPINTYLAQVGRVFDREPLSQEKANELAKRATEHVKLQVQRVQIGAKPKDVMGCIMVETKKLDSEQRVVTIVDTSVFHALGARDSYLENAVRDQLIQGMVDMILHPDNDLGNIASLILALSKFTSIQSVETTPPLMPLLMSLAEEGPTHSTRLSDAAEAKNPLNPFKMHGTEADDVRAATVMTLARIIPHSTKLFISSVATLIGNLVNDVSPKVRAAAFTAIRYLPTFPPDAFVSWVAGVTDSDPDVVVTAVQSWSGKCSISLSESDWRIAVRILDRCGASTNGDIRRAVARILPSVFESAHDAVKPVMSALITRLHSDVLWSVRKQMPAE